MISVAAAWPRRLLYGAGALDQLEAELGQMRAQTRANRAMLVTDAYIAGTDGARKVRQTAGNAGIELLVFDQVEENPCEGTVHSLAREISETDCKLIVALGGGSSIDCAKAANIVATHGGSISEYRGKRSAGITEKVLPLIAIPTTAGTGSEVTPVAMVTDLNKRTKYAVSSRHLIPNVAILDPLLTVSMSPQLTAWTGMDTLSRAIEAHSSPLDSPIADILAIAAVERIAASLPTAVRASGDLQARSEMLLAASLAGIAMAQNELGLVHALSRQISGGFGVPESLANAVLLPVVMEFNKDFARSSYAAIARAMGERVRNLSVPKAAEKGVQAVREMAAAVGIPEKLEGLPVSDDVIYNMSTNAMADPLAMLNPRPVTAHDVQYLLQQVLS